MSDTTEKRDNFENQLDPIDPWRSLAYAIVVQAAKDFKRYKSLETVRFFQSGWCQLLLGDISPEWLVETLDKRDLGYRQYGRKTNVTYQGLSIDQWEQVLGYGAGTIRKRVYHGMTLEKAVKMPLNKRNKEEGLDDGSGKDNGTD